ncbi:hypothetical protein F511_27361 [Dorcoceras hygrometricum]|uniref:Uncharacterized protein n=1 Tax=Dorcoceras hygrometricum TaxID=472368 RepID=A0A2Z7DIK4_9LAMI|nr:hypothetical protein F511_27361 [Dorcoceras hygrometricum]
MRGARPRTAATSAAALRPWQRMAARLPHQCCATSAQGTATGRPACATICAATAPSVVQSSVQPWRNNCATPQATVRFPSCIHSWQIAQPVRITTATGRATRAAIARPARYRTRSCARGGGAAMRVGADADATSIFLHFDSEKLKVRYNNAGVLMITLLATRVWLRPVSRGNRHFTVGGGRLRQSGPRPEARLLRQPALEGLTRSARTDSPRQVGRNKFRRRKAAAAQGGGGGF